MSWCMSRRRHDDDVCTSSQRHLLRKGARSIRLESNRLGLPAARPAIRQVALQLAAEALRTRPLGGMNPSLLGRNVRQAAGMIGMKMRQHHVTNIADADADRLQ